MEYKNRCFKCPFCNQNMTIHAGNSSQFDIDINGIREHMPNSMGDIKSDAIAHNLENEYLQLRFYECPNPDCRKTSVYLKGYYGDYSDIYMPIYPSVVCNQYPEFIPQQIRNDYYEACAIKNSSPKASAALCRRCLQGMIRNYWKIIKSNLNDEIIALKEKIDPDDWETIDATRKIGNIGAHMEKDVNLIIDIEPHEAERLIQLIEYLIENWYIKRYKNELMRKQIIEIDKEKQAQKKSKN